MPEPLVAAPAEPMADDLSIALLLTLERLSSLERAAFLLHDVFDMDYGGIAMMLGRTEESCRQLAARARQHVRDERPRFAASDEKRDKLFAAFEAVMTGGDVAEFAQLLADDAVLYADGGGKRAAALEPIHGKQNILQLFAAVFAQRGFFQRDELPGADRSTDCPASSCASRTGSRRRRSRSGVSRSSPSTWSAIQTSCGTSSFRRARARHSGPGCFV